MGWGRNDNLYYSVSIIVGVGRSRGLGENRKVGEDWKGCRAAWESEGREE